MNQTISIELTCEQALSMANDGAIGTYKNGRFHIAEQVEKHDGKFTPVDGYAIEITKLNILFQKLGYEIAKALKLEQLCIWLVRKFPKLLK